MEEGPRAVPSKGLRPRGHGTRSQPVAIARDLLQKVGYDPAKSQEILQIIEGHDSRRKALSVNDGIVKDADKLRRNTREGLRIDTKRFGETHEEGLDRLRSQLDEGYCTRAAREMALAEIWERIREREPGDKKTDG